MEALRKPDHMGQAIGIGGINIGISDGFRRKEKLEGKPKIPIGLVS